MTHVTLVLTPRYPLLSLAICTEALRVANRVSGRVAFDWSIASVGGKTAVSSSGMTVPVEEDVRDITAASFIILLSSYRPEDACHPDLLAWLRSQNRRGATIGCVDTAAYILAKAGILGRRKVVVHHEAAAAYGDLLGDRLLSDRYVGMDGRIASSGGGMATLDMVLSLIEEVENRDLADRAAFVLNYRRLPDRQQAREDPRAAAAVDPRLGRMVDLMHRHIADPLPVMDIVRNAGATEPTARRLFQRRFGRTPGRYYMEVRLDRAREFLRNSALAVSDIAGRVGFANAGSLTRAYSHRFGVSPSKDRVPVTGSERKGGRS